jgi:hypothetical protein
MATSDPDFAQAAQDFKRGGWITGVLGVAGMLARMLLSDHTYPWVKWVKHMVAGGLVGVITYFALYGTDIPVIYKSVLGSAAGAIAPELINKLKETVNNYGKKNTKKNRK